MDGWRDISSARGETRIGAMLAHQQQRARHRVGEVVVRAWRVVDAVAPAARRATLQAAELLIPAADGRAARSASR